MYIYSIYVNIFVMSIIYVYLIMTTYKYICIQYLGFPIPVPKDNPGNPGFFSKFPGIPGIPGIY